MRPLGCLAVTILALSQTAFASEARSMGPLPETARSQIFSPVVLPGTAQDRAMRAAGYEQVEYLLTGAANIYGENADSTLNVRKADVPYTTRLVIIRPRDPRRFKGIVQLGFCHPQLASAQLTAR